MATQESTTTPTDSALINEFIEFIDPNRPRYDGVLRHHHDERDLMIDAMLRTLRAVHAGEIAVLSIIATTTTGEVARYHHEARWLREGGKPPEGWAKRSAQAPITAEEIAPALKLMVAERGRTQ